MRKNFKLMLALVIGLFTVPMMGSTVFAQSADEIANGTYEDIGVRALEKGTNKESVANDFVQDPTLTIKDGNPTLTLGIGASGGDYADFDFTIEWVTVEGNEPTGSSDEGALTYYTFQLDTLDTVVPAAMEYVVPDFPPLSDGHEVEFDLELSGLDDLPVKDSGKGKVDPSEGDSVKDDDNNDDDSNDNNNNNENNTAQESGDNGDGTTEGEQEENPQTGESSNIALYFILLIGAFIPLAILLKRRFS